MEFNWKSQGGVLTCLSATGVALGTVKQSGNRYDATAFGKTQSFNFERSAKTFVQAAAGMPARIEARAADADKHPLHVAIDKMCDAKGIEQRDHLHRALDSVLAHRAKTKDADLGAEELRELAKAVYRAGGPAQTRAVKVLGPEWGKYLYSAGGQGQAKLAAELSRRAAAIEGAKAKDAQLQPVGDAKDLLKPVNIEM